MISRFAWLPALVLLLATGMQAASADEAKERAAAAGAVQWLVMVDAGQYAKSWQEAAGYFRNAITRDSWEQSVGAVRKPLGKVVSRNVKSMTYAKSLPGAPDGEYVVVQFETVFEHKASAVETVTPMLDSDGRWRVSGYFIQ
jgi:hypothetical protein